MPFLGLFSLKRSEENLPTNKHRRLAVFEFNRCLAALLPIHPANLFSICDASGATRVSMFLMPLQLL